jgi:DNA polymerase-3 subunit delta'
VLNDADGTGLAGMGLRGEVAKQLRAAAAKPVHAYLFVGPPGTGKMAAAWAFAAMLICPEGGSDGCETCERALRGVHPDFVIVEREGPSISIDQARDVSRMAARSSVEGGRKVIVLQDLHLARDAAPALLKTIEEPPPSTVFVALAEFVPPELVTIASRCVRVDFSPLSDGEIVAALVARGEPAERAEALARLAQGRLDRAMLLASDPEAEERQRAWGAVPARLDGTGATVAVLAGELAALLERSAGRLAARQEAEVQEMAERNSRDLAGSSGSLAGSKRTRGRGGNRAAARELEERHRREQRRQRTDELRTGLGALAGAYRDRAANGAWPASRASEAVALIDRLSADLAYNPGELLALQALLVRLDRLGSS